MAKSVPSTRIALLADRTYYVSTTGSDSNNGLSAAAPFLTVQHAFNVVALLDMNGKKVTVQLAAGSGGSYSNAASILNVPRMTGLIDPTHLLLQGDNTTPSNVTLTNTGATTPVIQANQGSMITVGGLKLVGGTGNPYCLNASEAAIINTTALMEYGACTGGYHKYANNGGVINDFGNSIISGGAAAHYAFAYSGAMYAGGNTINANSGAYAFSFGFVGAFNGGNAQLNGITFQNIASITGPRYALQSCSTCQTFGAGASYFPGSTAGGVSGGGVYA